MTLVVECAVIRLFIATAKFMMKRRHYMSNDKSHMELKYLND